MIAQFTKVIGSQVGMAVVGVITLPIIARNYQAETFGEFSLFLVLLGSISLVDFCRPILIRQYAEFKAPAMPPSSVGIAWLNVFVVTAVALALGISLLRTEAGIALALICCLHALASPVYADNANVYGAGDVQVYRNVAWSIAYLAVASAGFLSVSPYTYLLPFVVANFAIILLYQKKSSRPNYSGGLRRIWLIDKKNLRDAWHVLSFNVISAFVTSIDKIVLGKFVDADLYGRYMAQSSLALKGNLAGAALGQTIYPQLANHIEQEGTERALEYFSRIFCLAMLAIGILLVLPIIFGQQIVEILFGTSYTTGIDIFGIVLAGVYLQMLGMLLTPWQRALGDFRTARNAYLVAATFMLVSAVVLIPAYGVAGALGVYLVGRIGDIILFIHEFSALNKTRSFKRYRPWIALNVVTILGLVVYRLS